MRRAAKRDIAEQPIVEALEAIGCNVYRDLPGDLLIHRPMWGAGWFRVQEIKTGKRKTRKKQDRQRDFLAATGTPTIRTVEEALTDITRTKP